MPVLLLAGEQEFGLYTGAILHAEGFNAYTHKSVFDDSVIPSFLKQYDVVILAQHEIGAKKCEMLKQYVSEGGALIAFRPDTGLYDLFGISGNEGELSDGCVAIDTSHPTVKGLTHQPIQIHGFSDQYILKTGIVLATLCEDAGKKTNYPALVSNSFGSGVAYAFSYNLSESVVLTRQGNPLSAGREMDGINGIRAMDLFTGGWIDTSKNAINQADVQMNLLSRCMETTSAGKPLPRLWYFPDNLRCLVTLTNDGEYRTEADFEVQLSDMDSLGAGMTLYVLETNKVSRDWSDKWSSRGFEISGHPDDTHEAGDPQWSGMYNALAKKKKEIADLYGINMKTVVNHWFVWCGKDSAGQPEFAAQAMIEANQGLEMDINYANYDNGSTEGHFLGSPGYYQGNFNGSGLVMKFADSKGRILDLYQHLNNVYDQQYFEQNDPEGFFECFRGLMDRSLNNEIYSFISIKAHNDEYSFSRIPLQKMISYAAEQGIPVWTASELKDFLKARDDASFTNLHWNGKKLSFNLNSSLVHEAGLTFMIPARFEAAGINRLRINNKSFPFEIRLFKGKEHAFVTVKPGHSYNVEADYSN
ncbi:MAG TPA: hypothetical protein VHI78_08805 [Bacteroidales bacterium]|nr:hypothetical protein [Bacteroidales bacterium]